MTKVRKVGLVDMGSNAIRTEIIEFDDREWRTLEKHRAPVRLGGEVFEHGAISPETLQRAVDAMRSFAADCDQHSVDAVMAIATSAAREAQNGQELIRAIHAATGIQIEIISGETEARYLQLAVESRMDTRRDNYLLVDLGGGSVEVVQLDRGRLIAAHSYAIGAVRIARAIQADDGELVGDALTESIRAQIRPALAEIAERCRGTIDIYVATGGNIESIADLISLERELDTEGGASAIRVRDLERLVKRLAKRTIAERRARFRLRPDRADTIVPAAIVYAELARIAAVKRIAVPRVGVRSGLRAAAMQPVLRNRPPRSRG